MAENVGLPPGFVLDQAQGGLPPGFVLDTPGQQSREPSAIRAGAALGEQAYLDVGKTVTGMAEPLTTMYQQLGVRPGAGGFELGEATRGAASEEVSQFIAGREKSVQERLAKHMPEGIGGRTLASVIGLGLETPLFMIGGLPARGLGTATTTLGKAALAGAEFGGALAGEAAVRGAPASEVGQQALIGAAVGPAGVLAEAGGKLIGKTVTPWTLRTAAEALTFAAGEQYVKGHDLTVRSAADIIALITTLRLSHAALGRVVPGIDLVKRATEIARERGAITQTQADQAVKLLTGPEGVKLLEHIDFQARTEAERAQATAIARGEAPRPAEAAVPTGERPEVSTFIGEPARGTMAGKITQEAYLRQATPEEVAGAGAERSRLEQLGLTPDVLRAQEAAAKPRAPEKPAKPSIEEAVRSLELPKGTPSVYIDRQGRPIGGEGMDQHGNVLDNIQERAGIPFDERGDVMRFFMQRRFGLIARTPNVRGEEVFGAPIGIARRDVVTAIRRYLYGSGYRGKVSLETFKPDAERGATPIKSEDITNEVFPAAAAIRPREPGAKADPTPETLARGIEEAQHLPPEIRALQGEVTRADEAVRAAEEGVAQAERRLKQVPVRVERRGKGGKPLTPTPEELARGLAMKPQIDLRDLANVESVTMEGGVPERAPYIPNPARMPLANLERAVKNAVDAGNLDTFRPLKAEVFRRKKALEDILAKRKLNEELRMAATADLERINDLIRRMKLRTLPRDQQGMIDPHLLLPKFLREGAMKLHNEIKKSQEVLGLLKLARQDRAAFEKQYDEVVNFSKWKAATYTILQVGQLNKNIQNLQNYIELNRAGYTQKIAEMEGPDARIKEWHKLGPDQAFRVTDSMIEATIRGKEFTNEELVTRGLNEEALKVRAGIKQDFENFLTKVETGMLAEARRRLGDDHPNLAEELNGIRRDFDALRESPYFPLMRWGKHSVKVVNPQGEITYYRPWESKLEQLRDYAAWKAKAPEGWKVTRGYVGDESLALQGMPPLLAQRIAGVMKENILKFLPETERGKALVGLTETLNDLLYHLAPSQSWRKHLLARKGTKGYSMDGIRAYTSYFFHGANHLMRLNFSDKMLQEINGVSRFAKEVEAAGHSNAEISMLKEFMQQHFNYVMSPKNELASLRAIGFLWYLGAVPKAAFVNLTQVPLVSLPYLSQRYNLGQAGHELSRASKDVARFISSKNSKVTAEEAAALEWALPILDESFATTLGAVAEGRNLNRLFSSLKTQSGIRKLSGAAGYLFHISEQYNRRVTFLASYRLGRKAGLDDAQARAQARESVENTQFEYARWNRPRFMQGKRSVFFLFFQYMQNMAFLMRHDPANMRILTALFAAGGIAGLPFMEDLMDLADKAISGKNKRFDSRKWLREQLVEMDLNPDLIMHGTSRYGFGIPYVARQIGIPMGDFDLSASLSFGRPLRPTEPLLRSGALEPQNFRETIGRAAESLPVVEIPARALESVPYLWRLATGDVPFDAKRFEKMLPIEGRKIFQAIREYAQGEERVGIGGPTIAKFDTNNPQHTAEIIMQALGFAPTRVQQKYEKMFAEKETFAFYMTRHKELLDDLNYAFRINDKDEIKAVMQRIREYNQEVPYKLLSIKPGGIIQSLLGRVKSRALSEAGYPYPPAQGAEITQEYERAFPTQP